MPSFDAVSKIDDHELTNALDQANREITNRYDFKGSGAQIERTDAGEEHRPRSRLGGPYAGLAGGLWREIEAASTTDRAEPEIDDLDRLLRVVMAIGLPVAFMERFA